MGRGIPSGDLPSSRRAGRVTARAAVSLTCAVVACSASSMDTAPTEPPADAAAPQDGWLLDATTSTDGAATDLVLPGADAAPSEAAPGDGGGITLSNVRITPNPACVLSATLQLDASTPVTASA